MPQTEAAIGLAASVRSLLASFLDYVDVRLQLLKAEAGQAASTALRGALLLGAGIIFFIGAYAAGVTAAVVWIARTWWQGDVLPAIALMAGLHLLFAISALLAAHRCFISRRFFRHTLQELQTDKSWLQQTTPPFHS